MSHAYYEKVYHKVDHYTHVVLYVMLRLAYVRIYMLVLQYYILVHIPSSQLHIYLLGQTVLDCKSVFVAADADTVCKYS